MKKHHILFLLFSFFVIFLFAGFLENVDAATPTVDIKANGSDGPITIPYNSSVTFTVTLTNFVGQAACWAWGEDVYGATEDIIYEPYKAPISKTISNRTSSKTYFVKCYYSWEWDVRDSVIVNVSPNPNVPVTGVTLNEASRTVEAGDSYQLTATVAPSNATNKNVTWSSSNTNVAVVSNAGWVMAISPGPATITVTTVDGNKTASHALTVNAPPSAPTVNIKANGSDGPVAVAYNGSVTISWTSTNATSCSASGYWDGLRSIGSGSEVVYSLTNSATFTLTCVSGDLSASDSVTVNVSPQNVPVTGVTLNEASRTVEAGDSYQLTATVAPSNATNKNVTWSSSNTNVAVVSNAGWVMAISPGPATITVTTVDGNKTAVHALTVNVPLPLSPRVDIKANNLDGPIAISPGESFSLSWVSSNATSCSASGYWEGPKETNDSEIILGLTSSATFTLTCSLAGGSSVSDSITVNVSDVPAPRPLITVDIKADGSDGPIFKEFGVPVVISWTSNNATRCFPSDDLFTGNLGRSGSEKITPNPYKSSETYTVICRADDGREASDSVVVNITIAPRLTITANGSAGSATIPYGDSVTISWNATNADSCTSSGYYWSGVRRPSGSLKFSKITKTASFNLTCEGNGSYVLGGVLVNVLPKTGTSSGSGAGSSGGSGSAGAGTSSGAGSGTGSTGGSSTGSGGTSGGTAGSGGSGGGSGGSGSNGSSGGGGGTIATPLMPTVDIKANNSNGPIVTPDNSPVAISWTSTNATSCAASGDWSGAKPTSSSQTFNNIRTSKTYTLACSRDSNIASDSVIVNTTSSPWMTMIYPNGQETITEGSTANLTWLANNLSSNQTITITLERFDSNGVSCGKKEIGTAPVNQESYSWIVNSASGWQDVPDSCSAPFKYKMHIEISDSSGTSLFGESADYFLIALAQQVVADNSVGARIMTGGRTILQETGKLIGRTASNIASYFNDFIVDPIKNLLSR